MAGRTGEKIGWIAGWSGGFIWVAILSVLFFFQGKWIQGALGLGLTAVASAGIVFFAPWRFPKRPYWMLMLAPYVMFFLAVGWAIGSYGGLGAAGLNWRSLLWILPLLIPFGGLWKGKWQNSQEEDSSPETVASSDISDISDMKEPEVPKEFDEEPDQPEPAPGKKNRIRGIIRKVWNPISSLISRVFRRKKR